MKTIKDVIATYPDGWPDEGFRPSGSGILFIYNEACELGSSGKRLICTREEYEQALKESKMENKCDWYDYESGKPVIECPLHIEVVNPISNEKSLVLYHTTNESQMLITLLMNKDRSTNWVVSEEIKPLDHDKHQIKIVSLDWLVDSGIDCEFSDFGESWIVDRLGAILNQNAEYKYDNTYDKWKCCRPRQNHPMVLTDEQVKLIPDGFDYDDDRHINFEDDLKHIVTFKGLKDGYKYEWEE